MESIRSLKNSHKAEVLLVRTRESLGLYAYHVEHIALGDIFCLFVCLQQSLGDQLPNLQKGNVFDIQEGIPINGFDVFDAALKVTENIAYFLPKNTNTDQVRPFKTSFYERFRITNPQSYW